MAELYPRTRKSAVRITAVDEAALPAPHESVPDDEGEGEAQENGSLTELAESDLQEFFGPNGPLARQLDGYEMRPSQVEMAQAVKRTLLDRGIGLIEAPTGTGKSIAYLIPAILSGQTVVIATANKSLQHQIYTKDIPFLREVLQRPIRAVVVKGRSNYICNLKWEKELGEQQMFALYDREHDQIRHIRKWLGETDTGDVDDLPFMLSSDVRPRIVSFTDDCLRSECRYHYEGCWVNMMRDEAAEAQILITNHHLLLNALELGEGGERILPSASVYILDEAHQLEATATSVYETTVTDYTVELLLSRSVFKEHADEDVLDELRYLNTLAFQEAANLTRDNVFRLETELVTMKKLAGALRDLAVDLKKRNPYGERNANGDGAGSSASPLSMSADAEKQAEARKHYELAIESLNSTASKLQTVASVGDPEKTVRYAARVFDRRHVSIELHAAPIDSSSLLRRMLFHPENENGKVQRAVICTSATLAANGHFEHFKQRCGIDQTCEEVVLPTVFDYPKQSLLYQPALPAYSFQKADAFYAAAAQEIERLLEVSRGRTLCLFTNWSGLQQVADRLSRLDRPVIWPLRSQGDAPRNALLEWFKETPYSVLLATRSFWEGVDIPGDDLSLVVLDKMPFPTPGDPLHSARMNAIDQDGRSSFAEYSVPLMTLALKQGFGRLIRRSSDRGVVAILDERLTSKNYGRQARKDLPPARFSRDFKDVHRFFQGALGTEAEFAVNVWVDEKGGMSRRGGMRWVCQVLRLQDGLADYLEGEAPVASDPAVAEGIAEVEAALAGLRDLRRRIEQAKRSTSAFTVEVRCRPETDALFRAERGAGSPWGPARRAWMDECAVWRAVKILSVPRNRIETA
jgi:ATP-dependent DNA helicase DinG